MLKLFFITMAVGVGMSCSDDPKPTAPDAYPQQMAAKVAGYEVPQSLINKVRSYYEANKDKPQGGKNWFRVLIAFGVETHDTWTAMTAAEVEPKVQNWSGWKPVYEALLKLEESQTVIVDSEPEPVEPLQAEPQQETAPGSLQLPNGVSLGTHNTKTLEGKKLDLYVQANRDRATIGARPVRLEARRCKFGTDCTFKGTGTNWADWASIADYDAYFGVSTIQCDTDKDCISGTLLGNDWWQEVSAQVHRLPYTLYTVDDNKVGRKETRWEVRVPNNPSAVMHFDVTEDDLLQIGLRSGSWKGDHRLVDLTVDRDYWKAVVVNLTATGAARMTRVGTTGQGSQTPAAKATTTTLNKLESARGAVEIRAVCSGDGPGSIKATHPDGTSDEEQVCPAPPVKTNTKVDNFATATFPVRMSCSNWWAAHGGNGQTGNPQTIAAGWEQLTISPPNPLPPGKTDDDYRITDVDGSTRVYPFRPRPCNADLVHIWTDLGPQTAQVKCTVGEKMVAATPTDQTVINLIEDYIKPPYLAVCFK